MDPFEHSKRRHHLKTALTGTLVAALLGANACAMEVEQGDTSPDETVAVSEQALGTGTPKYGAVWAEVLPNFTAAQIKAKLSLLQGKDIALNLNWRSDINQNDFWAIVADAKSRNIQVNLWPLLPEGTAAQNTSGSQLYDRVGYFPGSTNSGEFIFETQTLMDTWTRKGYAPTTVIFDIEMRKDRMLTFLGMAKNLGVFTAISGSAQIVNFLRSGINRTQYANATTSYGNFVNSAHVQGWKAQVTTAVQMLDDYSDGDDALRQAFGVPLDGIAWDTVSFQAYRTLAQSTLGVTCTPFYVSDYGKMAKNRFGSKTGLDLGLTDGGVTTTALVYPDATSLRDDVEAALEAGIPASKLSVYSFDGMVLRNASIPSSQWFAAPSNHGFGWPALDLCAPGSHGVSIALDAVL